MHDHSIFNPQTLKIRALNQIGKDFSQNKLVAQVTSVAVMNSVQPDNPRAMHHVKFVPAEMETCPDTPGPTMPPTMIPFAFVELLHDIVEGGNCANGKEVQAILQAAQPRPAFKP